MRKQSCLCGLVFMLALAAPAVAQLTDAAATTKAEAILKNLQDDKTADVVKEFDAKMARRSPRRRVVFGNDGLVAGLAFQPVSMAVLPAAK